MQWPGTLGGRVLAVMNSPTHVLWTKDMSSQVLRGLLQTCSVRHAGNFQLCA
jgi:hypothetical protein